MLLSVLSVLPVLVLTLAVAEVAAAEVAAEVAVTVLIMFCSNVRGRESGRERISWSSCAHGEHGEDDGAAATGAGAGADEEADVASGDVAFVEEDFMALNPSLK